MYWRSLSFNLCDYWFTMSISLQDRQCRNRMIKVKLLAVARLRILLNKTGDDFDKKWSQRLGSKLRQVRLMASPHCSQCGGSGQIRQKGNCHFCYSCLSMEQINSIFAVFTSIKEQYGFRTVGRVKV